MNEKQSDIIDVHHEEMPLDNQVPVTAEIPLERQIQLQIARFNLSDQKIQELKDKYGQLSVAGVEDREGYLRVKTAWQLVRSKRTGLEKKGLDLRGDYNAIAKAIGAEEKRLIKLLEPLEEYLQSEWKKIDDEKAAEKRREEEEERQRVLARVNELLKLGAIQVGEGYAIGDTVSIDVATLRTMSIEQWLAFLKAATRRSEELKAQREREVREKKQAELELQNLRAEYEANQQKLAAEKLEFERQQAEFAKLQAEAQKMQLELQQQKEAAEALQAEEKRQATLTDEQRWDEYIKLLLAVPTPQLKTKSMQGRLKVLRSQITKFKYDQE